MNPKVSIIIPNYNYGKFIAQALESVLRQSFRDYEVIVIDDGSTDNSCEIIEQYSERFGTKLKCIVQSNQGVAVARNNGILKARGDYIAFLDADDIWLDYALQSLVDAIEGSNCGLVYGNVEYFDVAMEKRMGIRFTSNSELVPYRGKDCFAKLFVHGNFIPMDAAIMRSSVFKKSGLFDKRFRCGEDLDMWMRIALQYEIGYLDQILTHLRKHSSSLSSLFIDSAKADILMTHRMFQEVPHFTELVSQKQMDDKLYLSYYRLGIFYILDGKGKRGRAWLVKAWKINSNVFKNNIVSYFCISYLPLSVFFKSTRYWVHKIFRGV